MSQQVVEEIRDLLLQVSTLTELAEKQSVEFLREVKKWMKSVEAAFIRNKITLGAQIATYRGILLSVDRDGLIPEGMSFQRSPSRNKLRRAATTVFLQKTVEIMYSYLLQVSAALEAINRENNAPR